MVQPVDITYGTDPEAFFERNGAIIGSEKILHKRGLKSGYGPPVVVRDGVQFEFNPQYSHSVAGLAENLSNGFKALQIHMKGYPDVSLCFRGLVEVSREELDSLTKRSRVLGCQPSNNAYGENPITVNVKTYRKRSSGGHAHFGLSTLPRIFGKYEEERARVVSLFDIFVGNSCVMFDRDPGAAERRENYGRAGEYRLQPHGLEYRTLSNFWLRNYSLMSFVFGMGNFSVSVLNTTLTTDQNLEQELIDTVNIGNFIKAIDTNDYDLARTNFDSIRPFLVKNLPQHGFPLTPNNLDRFLTFTEGVRDEGFDAFFHGDIMDHWCAGKKVEFTDFLDTIY